MDKMKTTVYKGVSYRCHMRETLGGYYLEPIKCDNEVLCIPSIVEGVVVKGIIRGDLNTYSKILLDENNTTFKSVDGVLLSFDGSALILYPPQKKNKSFEIPNGVKYIFEESIVNHYLEKISFPDGVIEIEPYSVYGFNLKTVVLPASIKCIHCSAFKNNWGIEDVYYQGSKEEWEKLTIGYENEDILAANLHCNFL